MGLFGCVRNPCKKDAPVRWNLSYQLNAWRIIFETPAACHVRWPHQRFDDPISKFAAHVFVRFHTEVIKDTATFFS